ncbi:hypothetical protein PBV87_03405 [Niameybacter massiliensis]|uniref:Uncharacterized protein n=1 Tax=Holtiella tumoricola TaxID=3018743 RepID=A0AA42DK57_9FIRM|nr:hypothetical protein [Holtiella tumoricola]MDA3730552.1 hypothetical protein [Holtiella tumoricola]
MSTYRYSKTKSRGVQVKKIAIGLFLVSLVACGGVGINTYLKDKKIDETTARIEEVTAQKEALNAQVNELQEQTKELEAQVKKVEEGLWRFEPIIIPDSMK